MVMVMMTMMIFTSGRTEQWSSEGDDGDDDDDDDDDFHLWKNRAVVIVR